MNKKQRNRIVNLFVLLIFIVSQAVFLYHSHEDNSSENRCFHSENDNHIHNKQTDKCDVCASHLYPTNFSFKPGTIRFFKSHYLKFKKKKHHLISFHSSSILLRGPPTHFIFLRNSLIT